MAATLIHKSAHYGMHRLGEMGNNPAIWAWLNKTYGWWDMRENYERVGRYLGRKVELFLQTNDGELTKYEWEWENGDINEQNIQDPDVRHLIEKEYLGMQLPESYEKAVKPFKQTNNTTNKSTNIGSETASGGELSTK